MVMYYCINWRSVTLDVKKEQRDSLLCWGVTYYCTVKPGWWKTNDKCYGEEHSEASKWIMYGL